MSLNKKEVLEQVVIVEAESAAIEIVTENLRTIISTSSNVLENTKDTEIRLILNNVLQHWTKLLITVVQEDIKILEKKKALGEVLFAEFGLDIEEEAIVSSKVH